MWSETHPWLYDERRQVGTDYSAAPNVAAYDLNMQRLRDISNETEVVASALSLSPADEAWEVGCGTGQLAIGLAAHCRHVYASDVSHAMLAFARRHAEECSVKNVSFEEGGFLAGFMPPEPVYAVVSQLALHHLPDLWKLSALKRIVSALRPGGKLFLRDVIYPSGVPDYNAYFAGLIAGVRRAGGDELAEQTIVHIRDEYSTFAWIIEEMFRQAGLTVVERMDERFTTAYVCTRRAG